MNYFAKFLSGIIILFLLTFIVSCSKEDSPTEPTGEQYSGAYGTVAGKFTAPNGNPIPGVQVSIVSNYTNLTTVVTDINGEFTHTKVPVGSQTLKGLKGSFSATYNVTVVENQTTTIPTVIMQPQNKLAFVDGSYDRIQDIIRELGYLPDSLQATDLANSAVVNINRYSALFLNCGMDEILDTPTKTNLTNFLKAGGLIYASDWACSYVQLLYPGKFSYVKDGDSQDVLADIVDQQTQVNLGKTQINITYDLSVWAEIDTLSTEFKIIVQGDYSSNGVTKNDRPLAVYKTEGEGVIVYTTFHNEANATADMKKILEEFIFF